jgi:stress-induced-phosphoprotein 1
MTSANGFKEKGNQALNAGNVKEAVEHYSSAIALDPTSHVYFSNRSAAYCKLEEYEKALEDADECIKLNPKWGKGWSRKASALEFLGRHADALEAYDEGLKVDPNNQQLNDGKTNALTNVSRSERSMPNMFGVPDLWSKLERDPRTKEFVKDPTFKSTIEALQKNPNEIMKHLSNPKVMAALSVLMGIDVSGGDAPAPPSAPRQRAWEEAAPKKETSPKPAAAPKEEPMDVPLTDEEKEAMKLKELGNEAYKAKKFDEALEHYGKAFSKDGSNVSILTNMAAVFFEQEKYVECISKCEEAIEIGREHRADFKLIAKAYARIGNAHLKLNQRSDAVKFFQKSLSEHRDPAIIKKVQLIEKQIKEEAEKAYLDPAMAEEERQRGNDFFTQGDYPNAVKAYSEAIKRNPEDAKIFSNRAAAYSKLMEFNLALKDCDKCIELDPQFIKGHIRKGHICIALKNFQKAIEAFEKALVIDSTNQEANDGYKQAMMAINSDPEATRKRAMEDPEVQSIMGDPAMRMILEQMQREPGSLQDHLKNPAVAQKLRKLIEAGLIAIR